MQKKEEEKINALRERAQTDAGNLPIGKVIGFNAWALEINGIETLQDFLDCWEADSERFIEDCDIRECVGRMLKDLEKIGIKLEKPESIKTTKDRILEARDGKTAGNGEAYRMRSRVGRAGKNSKRKLILEISKLTQAEADAITKSVLRRIAKERKNPSQPIPKNGSGHGVDKPPRKR